MKRRDKGTPEGGQFAPDTRGATLIPSASDVTASSSPDDGSRNIAVYAQNLAAAYTVYQQRKPEPQGMCRYCGKQIEQRTDHLLCFPQDLDSELAREKGWTQEKITFVAKESVKGEMNEFSTEVQLPARNDLRGILSRGKAARFTIESFVAAYDESGLKTTQWGPHDFVRGYVTVWNDSETGELVVDTRALKCDCLQYRNTYHCPHIDMVGKGVEQRCESRVSSLFGRRRRSEEAAREAALRIASSIDRARGKDWTRDPVKAAEAALTWRADSDVLYSGDPDAFLNDVNASFLREREGYSPFVYETENVLDGLCKRGSGQAFGIELEYEFPVTSQWGYKEIKEANARIAQELYDAGITCSNRQEQYGYSDRNGFRDYHTDDWGRGTWTLEEDGSVSGELVSPGMYDEPETWQKLDMAISIIKKNGGIASLHAGSHVHVGTASYGVDPAPYAELTRLVNQHEDVIARLSSDPARGTHRNNGYAAPLPPIPPEGFSSITGAVNWQFRNAGRSAFLNLDNCSWNAKNNHVEFRSFDATLDEGVVQMQIKLAVGMVAAAERNASAGGTTRGKEPWGSHAARHILENPIAVALGSYSMKNGMSRSDIINDSTTTRSFLDTVFRRREDKVSAAAVFGHTSWSTPEIARVRHYYD